MFGDARFARLTTISNGHMYNLRNSVTSRAKRPAWTRTRPATVAIGLRQAPEPKGRPGHVRVDTMHKGDRDGVKGLYLINLVDEVTQREFVGAAAGISERFLPPRRQRLRVHQPPGGRSPPEAACRRVHEVARAALQSRGASPPASTASPKPTMSPFLNFHRPCLFATEHRDGNGRIRRKYLARDVMTPWARLRSLVDADAERFLKPGLGFVLLDAVATAETDLEAPRRVQAERRELFLRISADMPAARVGAGCRSGKGRSPLGQGWRPQVTR